MRVFLPQSVPAYAATETMTQVKQKYADYTYKEATLNPTNPRDRAADWEADLVQEFKNQPTVTQLSGERDTPTGRSLYIARPIKITNPACLACHTTPEMAPATMIKRYGPGNGFGWKLNDIVGTQVVSVPMTLPIRNAERAFYTFMGSLAAVFLLVFVVLNVMLGRMIVHPIARMAHAADQVSTGNFEIPELAESGKDEIAVLGRAFNRMRRSLQKALQMIEG
jgi:protein-histidine pros-kinase